MRDRGRAVLKRVNIPPDHKFPAVRMTNPMMFAMTNARRPVQGGDKEENAKGKTAATRYSKQCDAALHTEMGFGQRTGTLSYLCTAFTLKTRCRAFVLFFAMFFLFHPRRKSWPKERGEPTVVSRKGYVHEGFIYPQSPPSPPPNPLG